MMLIEISPLQGPRGRALRRPSPGWGVTADLGNNAADIRQISATTGTLCDGQAAHPQLWSIGGAEAAPGPGMGGRPEAQSFP